MKKKINIAELLKDCPKGMELDCVLFENPVKYVGCGDTDNYPITILTEEGEHFYLTNEGYMYDRINSKCVIFPKGKTTWEGFIPPRQFKDGDILSYQYKGFKNRTIYIYMQHSRMNTTYYVALSGDSDLEFMVNDKEGHALNSYNDSVRLATKEEKEKLFQAIKDNGYKWNEETKTLEKLVEPKFKVGDKVLWNYDTKIIRTISKVQFTKSRGYVYWIDCEGCSSGWWNENELTPIPNKFDITTLKPFDKVLVRENGDGEWGINFFGFYNYDERYYYTTGNWMYKQCIPYEGNEYLLGTTDDCDNFYKTW